MDCRSAAARLKDRIPTVLDLWDERVRASFAPIAQLPKAILTYHFPKLLLELASALELASTDWAPTSSIMKEHARLRAGILVYTVGEILDELFLLWTVVVELLPLLDSESRSIVDRFFEWALKEATREHYRLMDQAAHVDETLLQVILNQARCILLSAEVTRDDERDESILIFTPLRFDATSAQRLLNLSLEPEENVFMAWQRLRVPAENAAYSKALENKDFNDGDVFRQEFRIVDRDGTERWIFEEINVHAIGVNHWRIVGVITDVTERMKLQDDLRRRAADLEEAAHYKDQFLAILGHELRNPLAAMSNTLFVLHHNNSDNSSVVESCSTMERQLKQMLRLVDDLRDAARIRRDRLSIQKERFDLKTVLERSIETMRPKISARQHRLNVSFPPHSLPIDGDPLRLHQVFTNLLENSAKYTEPGGWIDVTASMSEGNVALIVKDTGIGMEPSFIPRIFDFFVQADRALTSSQGGLGIGLALAKGLIELHGGEITASSEGPGCGSEFRITLPLARDIGPGSISELGHQKAESSEKEGEDEHGDAPPHCAPSFRHP